MRERTAPWQTRVEAAIAAFRAGNGVLITDAENRENEGDLVYPAESITADQMALLIRECSGIVCLVLTHDKAVELDLPQMVRQNKSRYGTAFTVSIEAAQGVTTGVSARDRVTTVRAAIADLARPEHLNRPGHVFPIRARPGGVLERPGHTEATMDLLKLSGKKPYGVLCELTNADGSMARLPEVQAFAGERGFPWLTVADIVAWRQTEEARKVSKLRTASAQEAAESAESFFDLDRCFVVPN